VAEADGSSGPGFGEEGDKEEGREGGILRKKNAPEREMVIRTHGVGETTVRSPKMAAGVPLNPKGGAPRQKSNRRAAQDRSENIEGTVREARVAALPSSTRLVHTLLH